MTPSKALESAIRQLIAPSIDSMNRAQLEDLMFGEMLTNTSEMAVAA